MKRVRKNAVKKLSRHPLHDRYWHQVMQLAGQGNWDELVAYVASHPWIATASMGPNVLPDYLAGEKEYGLLRLLCNIEDVPVAIVRRVIELGARDSRGRGYLERLLAGAERVQEDPQQPSPADSPVVAALVLATCDEPKRVIERMHQVLEKGVEDSDSQRRLLAQRCIARSQFFYDLLMFLYQLDRIDLLVVCLNHERFLEEMSAGRVKDNADLETILVKEG